MFSSCTQVLSHLDNLGLFHMDLTLGRMRNALCKLSLQRLPYTAIQVVGTNGKGSTSTFLASLSRAHGLRTGLYTSPHFVSPRERILYNGAMLSEARWAKLATAVYAAEPTLTYFEFLTVLAALAFAEAKVDLAVVEAGLGGRWDATTALSAEILCLTPVSKDHEQVLGSTLRAIADDKSDAIRPGMTVIHAPQQAEVLEVLCAKAEKHRARLLAAESRTALPAESGLGLRGPHQRQNAQLALTAWRVFCEMTGRASHSHSEAQGLAQAFLPGRLQHCVLEDGTVLLLDGAHNPHGLEALRLALQRENIQPSAIIFSCLADKDREHMLPYVRELAKDVPLWIPTIAHNARAAAGETLAPCLGPHARAVPALTDALCAATQGGRHGPGPVLVCGSLYLLGELFTLYPHLLHSPHAMCEDL